MEEVFNKGALFAKRWHFSMSSIFCIGGGCRILLQYMRHKISGNAGYQRYERGKLRKWGNYFCKVKEMFVTAYIIRKTILPCVFENESNKSVVFGHIIRDRTLGSTFASRMLLCESSSGRFAVIIEVRVPATWALRDTKDTLVPPVKGVLHPFFVVFEKFHELIVSWSKKSTASKVPSSVSIESIPIWSIP